MPLELTNQPPYYEIQDGAGAGGQYIALLTQTSTNAPVATVLKNTLGTLTWTYLATGVYTLTGAGLFTPNKTTVLLGQSNQDGNGILYYYLYDAGNSLDLSVVRDTGVYADSYMGNATIIITVYP